MINFLRSRGFVVFFTFVWMIAAIGLSYYRYQQRGSIFSYSIDFTGGTQYQFKFDKDVTPTQIKEIVSEFLPGEVVIRQLSTSDFIVRTQEITDARLGEILLIKLRESLPNYNIELLQSENVGPGVGESLWVKSLQAILLSMIAILIYIAFRFWSFAFSAGAVFALLHDTIFILALILFLDMPISVNIIGAIVAILGYSINDTIVIFSQIREYLLVYKAEALSVIVNKAINKTLRRTMLTSFSTALPLLMLFLFGGEALYDLSLILLAGIIIGTFSSILIASPLMMMLYRRE
jgi:preprotein translocase subunit SecF